MDDWLGLYLQAGMLAAGSGDMLDPAVLQQGWAAMNQVSALPRIACHTYWHAHVGNDVPESAVAHPGRLLGLRSGAARLCEPCQRC